jgi:tetratricopeptide (TPR) repeat protein
VLGAVRDLQTVLASNPGDTLSACRLGDMLWILANIQARTGEDPRETYRKSIEAFSQALKKNPAIVNALRDRGNARLRLGEEEAKRGGKPRKILRAAVADYEEAIDRGLDDPNVHGLLGHAHQCLGDAMAKSGEDPRPAYRKAADRFREATRATPEDWQALYNLGLNLERLERFAEAVEAYASAFKIAGDRAPEVKEALARAKDRLEKKGVK